MTLQEAIQLIISLKGAEFLGSPALMNALADCKIYEETPAYKNILRVIIREGYVRKALVVQDDEARLKQLAVTVAGSYLWPVELVSHIMMSFHAALKPGVQVKELSQEAMRPEESPLPKPKTTEKRVKKPAEAKSAEPKTTFSPLGVMVLPFHQNTNLYVIRSEKDEIVFSPYGKKTYLFVNIIKKPLSKNIRVFLSISNGKFMSRYYFNNKIELSIFDREPKLFCDDPSESVPGFPNIYTQSTKVTYYRFLQAPRVFFEELTERYHYQPILKFSVSLTFACGSRHTFRFSFPKGLFE